MRNTSTSKQIDGGYNTSIGVQGWIQKGVGCLFMIIYMYRGLKCTCSLFNTYTV